MSLKYYQELITFLNNNSCKMLTTYQDFFNNTNKYKKISIISSCGHESHNIYCHVLKNRNTGIICKNCIINKPKYFNNNNIDFDTFKFEYDSL